MKLGKFLKIVGIAGIFITGNLIYSRPEEVQAQPSSNAFVVFVNGSGDCCAESMSEVIKRVKEKGHTVWTTSYASFKNGSTTNKVPVVNLSTDLDAKFIVEATLALNSIPESRPIVLIGHSYGGDSILKILPLIKRRIQLVVTIDPVGTGGFRSIATARNVPSNVDYFMNRWEENALAEDNIVPFDSRTTNGSIPCSAKVCDQEAQNLARNADGSENRISCESWEVSCPGYEPWPGGSNGTKAKRLAHNDMPMDAFIQHIVGDRISEVLVASSNSNPQNNERNRLYIRSFNGQTFGTVSSSQAVSGADSFRGWSWNGATTSYVAFENGQSTLYIRPFDGQTFGTVSSSQSVSSSDSFRGWSWDGKTASYVTFKSGGQSILYIRPFDGQTFGTVLSSQVVSSSDSFRGWSWNGTIASYVTINGNGGNTLYIRPFDGQTFGTVSSSQSVSSSDSFQGWSWDGKTASYVAK